MLQKYTSDEFWNLYEDLPDTVRAVFWDDDIPNRISKIAERFQLKKTEKQKLLRITTHLFLGTLPPSQIGKIMEKNILLERSGNENLFSEFIRFIVSPTQHLLREIYSEEEFRKIGVKNSFSEKFEEKENESHFGDTYREPIE